MAEEVSGGPGGSSIVHSATVTLTDEQIKALPSGDFNIIPPVGANQIIVPQGGVAFAKIFAPYTNIASGASWIPWFTNGGNPFAGGQLATLVGQSNTIRLISTVPLVGQIAETVPTPNQSVFGTAPVQFTGVVTGADVDLSSGGSVKVGLSGTILEVGDSLDFHVDNLGAGDLTGGDARNYLDIALSYMLYNTVTKKFE